MLISPYTANRTSRRLAALLGVVFCVAFSTFTYADSGYPYPGMQVVKTPHAFKTLVQRVRDSVKAQPGLNVVARASANVGARSLGQTIPGNAVIMVYGPKYAVRMLAASVPAGIEAPLVMYVTEGSDGTATLTYRLPSAVFAPYESADLNSMAAELDTAFAAIANRAAQAR